MNAPPLPPSREAWLHVGVERFNTGDGVAALGAFLRAEATPGAPPLADAPFEMVASARLLELRRARLADPPAARALGAHRAALEEERQGRGTGGGGSGGIGALIGRIAATEALASGLDAAARGEFSAAAAALDAAADGSEPQITQKL